MKINILGTDYTLANETSKKNPKMENNSGLCEAYSKRIIINTEDEDDVDTVENYDGYCHRVLRHEAFHAIFFEAGLDKYYGDEELVEALAILYPKIKTIMLALDGIEISKI